MYTKPRKNISIFDIAYLLEKTYISSFTPKNIAKVYKLPRINPLNQLTFDEDDFASIYVTDHSESWAIFDSLSLVTNQRVLATV